MEVNDYKDKIEEQNELISQQRKLLKEIKETVKQSAYAVNTNRIVRYIEKVEVI